MTINYKRTVTLDVRYAQEVELYFAAGTVRSKIGNKAPEIHTYVNSLEDYVNGAILQSARIEQTQSLSIKSQFDMLQNPFSIDNSHKLMVLMNTKFLDIHFYAICIDKIDKLYRKIFERISPFAASATNTSELREKKKLAESHLRVALSSVTEARKYLEHMDKEIAAGNFDGFRIEFSETGSRFTYGKGHDQVTIDIDNLEQVKRAYESLIEYIDALPDTQ